MADFDTNLSRLIAAELQLLCELRISRELFGKSFFELGAAEKAVMDRTLTEMLAARYSAATPQWLADQVARGPLGFEAPPGPAGPPSPAPTAGKA